MELLSNFFELIKTLEDSHEATIEHTDNGKTIYVYYDSIHSFKIKFTWSNDHFIGYFIDADENFSQAIISIWSISEAIQFINAFGILVDLRAKRK